MNSPVKSLRGARVFVGLSGGVDSAVTAALLKRAGAEVRGVFIKGWYPPGLPCTYAEDRKDAMRVAASLSIPFSTLDASDEYRRGVIEYLLREYQEGRTPNPDVMCNREVKFGAFARFAKAHDASFIATGHYARTSAGRLYAGVDAAKDQSYFLWAVPKEALLMTLFPLGEMRKEETRALARRLRLPNAEKRDSQGICFLGAVSVDEYLRAEFEVLPGIAKDAEGNEIGRHEGALLYTLGARASLREALPGPWYVVAKDIGTNELVVSRTREPKETKSLRIAEENWLCLPEKGKLYEAVFRYHGARVEGIYDAPSKTFLPSAPLPEPAAPGQSLVLYEKDEVIGGGIIAA